MPTFVSLHVEDLASMDDANADCFRPLFLVEIILHDSRDRSVHVVSTVIIRSAADQKQIICHDEQCSETAQVGGPGCLWTGRNRQRMNLGPTDVATATLALPHPFGWILALSLSPQGFLFLSFASWTGLPVSILPCWLSSDVECSVNAATLEEVRCRAVGCGNWSRQPLARNLWQSIVKSNVLGALGTSLNMGVLCWRWLP
jgi:hypothetical protein